jgi:hypothetical protein
MRHLGGVVIVDLGISILSVLVTHTILAGFRKIASITETNVLINIVITLFGHFIVFGLIKPFYNGDVVPHDLV